MRRRKTEMEIEKEREKGTKKRKIMHKIQYRTVTNEHFNSNLITVVVFFFILCSLTLFTAPS